MRCIPKVFRPAHARFLDRSLISEVRDLTPVKFLSYQLDEKCALPGIGRPEAPEVWWGKRGVISPKAVYGPRDQIAGG